MDPWTTRKLLAWTTKHFEDKQVDSPRVAAEMLLGHVLEVPRLKLYMEPDRPATEAERDTFRALVARAGRQEPVDYLIGKTPFFGLELRVTPATLIPRPSTETIIEHVLQTARPPQPPEPPEPPEIQDEIPTQHQTFPAAPTAPRELTYIPEPLLETSRDSAEPSVPVSASDPRPQTPNPRPHHIADLGTGSGAIAIALAKHLPNATFVATDLSEAALDVARQNAADLGVADRIDFRHGDLFAPLGDERFDVLLSNPPYISDAEWAEVLPNVRNYEPTTALRSGRDGLDHLRRLIAGAADHLKPGGQLLLEMSSTQETAVRELAAAAGWVNAQILKDHERLPRVLVAERAD